MRIGLQNEGPLHADLKAWYAQPGDHLEVEVDGYVVDILQEDLLVEIQTGNFASVKHKVTDLTKHYPLRLVYPIAQEKWIVRLPQDGLERMKRRRSPKRGQVTDVFKELVSFPHLILHPNFSLEVLMITEEEVRKYVGKRRWRTRGWGIQERRLLSVSDRRVFEGIDAIRDLIPVDLPDPFTSFDLGNSLGQSRRMAQKTAYCLRKMGLIEEIGKRDRSKLYRLQSLD